MRRTNKRKVRAFCAADLAQGRNPRFTMQLVMMEHCAHHTHHMRQRIYTHTHTSNNTIYTYERSGAQIPTHILCYTSLPLFMCCW